MRTFEDLMTGFADIAERYGVNTDLFIYSAMENMLGRIMAGGTTIDDEFEDYTAPLAGFDPNEPESFEDSDEDIAVDLRYANGHYIV